VFLVLSLLSIGVYALTHRLEARTEAPQDA
jgi:hypothetical protein